MNLTLRQLRAFVAVAQTGGFTSAAARLHLTQSALSGLVQAVERELGLKLFERTTRKVTLTQAGRDLLPAAERLLAELTDAVATTRARARRARGRLALAVTPTFASTTLPRVLVRYRSDHPDVNVFVRDDAGPAQIRQLVLDGKVDLGVAPLDRGHRDLLAVDVLMDDSMVAVCPNGHPLTRKSAIAWRELAGVPCIGFPSDNAVQAVNDAAAQSAGVQIELRYEVTSITSAMALVDAGLGVSVLPAYTRRISRAYRVEFRKLIGPTVRRELCLLRLRDRVLSEPAQTFRQLLIAQRR